MIGHGKPSYRTRESLRKDFVSKSSRPRDRMKLPQSTEDNVIIVGNAQPFGGQYPAIEFGNHNSGIGP